MTLAHFANATDLEQWAARDEARTTLPQLVRRLIYGTGHGIHRTGFRSGEGVALSGWDGIVIADRGDDFVPEGTSAWEMSTSRNRKQEADDNYKKRTQNPLGIDPATSTFVFVTPRRWKGKAAWRDQRLTDARWRAVIVHDADDLHRWLDSSYAVHLWLSLLLGKHPVDAIDLESHWLDWSEVTRPTTAPALVLAGRTSIKETLISWLRGSSAEFAIKADSRDEALATIASVIDGLDAEERLKYFSRALIVRSEGAWYQLVSSKEPLVLIPTFDRREALPRAVRGGHRIIVPLGRGDSATQTTVEIPRLSTEEATKVLVDSGIPDDRARSLARLARRSLVAFRRRLATSPEVQQPPWARPENARSFVPILLAGAWSDSNKADQRAVSTLANQPYDTLRDNLLRWRNEPDTPIRRIGDSWYLVSPDDMFTLLTPFIIAEDFVRLEEVALQALGEIDPRFDLPEEERWMAAWKGKVPTYSGLLREALADTLALLGSRGEDVRLHGGATVSDYAGKIVRVLLERANADWRLWASLSFLLRALGEAAPDIFLSAADDGLVGEAPVLLNLFSDSEDPMFSTSPHTGLLWALETLAWSQDHLGHVADVLATLSEIDPSGRLLNRPQQSLLHIFLSWYPQTAATLDQRLRVLDALRARHPEVYWRLLLGLLSNAHGMCDENPKPHFREWHSARPDLTDAEVQQAYHEVVARVLVGAGNSGTRWQSVIGALSNLPQEDYGAALRQLETINPDEFSPSDRLAFWNELRCVISRHRTHPGANWALLRNEVDRLADLWSRFEPRESNARFGWLFGHSPELPQGRSTGWEENDKAIAAARVEALQVIHDSGGIQAIADLASSVAAPFLIGETLGTVGLFEEEHNGLLLAHLDSAEESMAELSRGLVIGSLISSGREWITAKLATLGAELTARQRAVVLACSPSDPVTWDSARSFGPETEEAYWRLVNPYTVRYEGGLEQALDKLLEYGRPVSALEVLYIRRASLSAATIAVYFERAFQTPPRDERQLAHISNEISELLQILAGSADIGASRVASLEWNLLPFLSHREHVPRRLHEELARNPQFFADVIRFIYGVAGEEPPGPVSPDRQARAQQGFGLLRSWRRLPGSLSDGGIDAEKLINWVDQARAALMEIGRLDPGDRKIGEILSGSPMGSDGAWPHEAVREVVEKARSADFEEGLENERINARGVVIRTLTEGGVQDHQLVNTYRAYAALARDRWPRTAALLLRIANYYKHLGRREDEDAELREDLRE